MKDETAALSLSCGCLLIGFLAFTATVFVIAAAIKWVLA